MPDLEALLRDARPEWPEPSAAAEARARAAAGLGPVPRSPRGWLGRTARARGARLLVPVALLVTAGAAVAATLISSGSAGTSPGRPASLDFGPPEVAGTPVDAFDAGPAVAVDGRGVVTAAWARAGRIVVSTRAPGDGWSPATRLSDPAVRAAYPRVGADDAGRVTVTWRERTAARRIVRRFRLPSGRPAGELRDLSGERWAVVARTRAPGGGWAAAERLSDDTASVRDMEEPGLAVAPDGRTVVTWDVGGAVWSRVRPARGAWGPAVEVGRAEGEAVDPQLAASSAGGAILTWSNRVGTGFRWHYEIRAALLGGDGRWQAPSLIDGRARNQPHARGAMGAGGDAVVVWMSEALRRVETSAAARPAGGDWSSPALVVASRGLFGLPGAPAVDRDGVAVVLSGSRGVAATLGAGGSWTPLPLPPVAGRVTGLAAVADRSGRIVTVRDAQAAHELLVAPLGGASVAIPRRSGGLVSIATGRDGTTAVAWAGGTTRTHAMVAVAEAAR